MRKRLWLVFMLAFSSAVPVFAEGTSGGGGVSGNKDLSAGHSSVERSKSGGNMREGGGVSNRGSEGIRREATDSRGVAEKSSRVAGGVSN
jgi:hypothetical protein